MLKIRRLLTRTLARPGQKPWLDGSPCHPLPLQRVCIFIVYLFDDGVSDRKHVG